MADEVAGEVALGARLAASWIGFTLLPCSSCLKERDFPAKLMAAGGITCSSAIMSNSGYAWVDYLACIIESAG